jgi:uncharacterized protein (TIGR02001 family)
MKNLKVLLLTITLAFAASFTTVNAQEESSPVSVGGDLVSRNIFRGLDFGNSPAIQPSIEASLGNFSIGAWGSYAFLATPSGIEADIYAGYAFDFGLYLGITDYYFPGEQLAILGNDPAVITPIRTGTYFDYENSHFFEANLSQEFGDFYLTANWMFANGDNDLYFEAGYSFPFLDIWVGAGNEVYTKDGGFNVVNIGLSATKELQFTEEFSLPVSTSLILNPNMEQIHLVFGISL